MNLNSVKSRPSTSAQYAAPSSSFSLAELSSRLQLTDETSVQASVELLLSDEGTAAVLQAFSPSGSAAPEVKTFLSETLGKLLSSKHCSASQIRQLTLRYAERLDLCGLLSPVWPEPHWSNLEPESGVDRVWNVALKFCDRPDELRQLLTSLNERQAMGPGWKPMVDFLQFMVDHRDDVERGSVFCVRQFLHESAMRGEDCQARRAFFGEMWLTAVVNGLPNPASLSAELVFVSPPFDEEWKRALLDPQRHPELLTRLPLSVTREMSESEQLSLVRRRWIAAAACHVRVWDPVLDSADAPGALTIHELMSQSVGAGLKWIQALSKVMDVPSDALEACQATIEFWSKCWHKLTLEQRSDLGKRYDWLEDILASNVSGKWREEGARKLQNIAVKHSLQDL